MQVEKVFQEFRPHASGKSQFNTVIRNMEEYSKTKKVNWDIF